MLRRAIDTGGVLLQPPCERKEQFFELAGQAAAEKGLVSSREEFVAALMEREEQMSTEVEAGVALPHARTECVKEIFIYLMISTKGVKFKPVGGKVKIAFLVGAPPQARHYLDIMAMIARLLQKKQFREALLAAGQEADVAAVIEEYSRAEGIDTAGARNFQALFLVLTDSSAMETAMELAIELGVKGTQVFDTTNAARKITMTFPFLSLFSARGSHISSQTLFGLVDDERIAGRLFAHLKKEGIDIAAPGVGALFTVPAAVAYGAIDEEIW